MALRIWVWYTQAFGSIADTSHACWVLNCLDKKMVLVVALYSVEKAS